MFWTRRVFGKMGKYILCKSLVGLGISTACPVGNPSYYTNRRSLLLEYGKLSAALPQKLFNEYKFKVTKGGLSVLKQFKLFRWMI